MIGCICCHGPTLHHGYCPICDAKELKNMSDDNEIPLHKKFGKVMFCEKCNKPLDEKWDYDDTCQSCRDSKNNNITRLVPTKSDADYALELKKRIIDAYQPFLDILTEAKKHGFEIQMQSAANPIDNKVSITILQIIKIY